MIGKSFDGNKYKCRIQRCDCDPLRASRLEIKTRPTVNKLLGVDLRGGINKTAAESQCRVQKPRRTIFLWSEKESQRLVAAAKTPRLCYHRTSNSHTRNCSTRLTISACGGCVPAPLCKLHCAFPVAINSHDILTLLLFVERRCLTELQRSMFIQHFFVLALALAHSQDCHHHNNHSTSCRSRNTLS